jgi:hypothetical protein
VTQLRPMFDFAQMSDRDIADAGLDAAEAAFLRDVKIGVTNGDSLIMTVGWVQDGTWIELGRRGIGPDADQFGANIDPVNGKLATALVYGTESVAAYQLHGEHIPEGPQRYTGGVYYVARAKTADRGWLMRIFAGAGSGVQGHIDMASVYTALTHMGAFWALKMLEQYGKG